MIPSRAINRPTMKLTIDIWGQTDTGKIRDHNEDSFAVAEDLAKQEWGGQKNVRTSLGALGALLVVADGMGGTNAGEVASDIAVKEVRRLFSELAEAPQDIHAYLKQVIMEAHQAILAHAKAHPKTRGMGTTLILAWVHEGMLYVAWSGDSRCYLYREGIEVRPLTDDHSLVWEMVKNDVLTPEQARIHPDSNIITQSLGNHREAPQPEILRQAVPLQAGDRLLLCSDGLNSMVSDEAIGEILGQRSSPKLTCNALIQAANEAGGYDNTTTLLIDVLEVSQEPILPLAVESEEAAGQFEQTASIDPLIAVQASELDEETSSNNSWFWIIGGIILFGGLTLAGIFWVGQRSADPSLSPSLSQQSDSQPPLVEDSFQVANENELIAAHEAPPASVNRGISLRSATADQAPASNNDNDNLIIDSVKESEKAINASSTVNSRLRRPSDLKTIQQKVTQILNLKYNLIRYDRLDILNYKPLSQKEKNSLRYIRTRVLNQQPNSIYHDLTKLVRLGGEKQGEVVDIKNQDSQVVMQQLDKLVSELNRFEKLIRQMEE